MIVDFSTIPDGWFLQRMRQEHTNPRYAGEKHQPTGVWLCDLQHVTGGRLVSGKGASPQGALVDAIQHALGENTMTDNVDNHWGWKAAEIREQTSTWTGYVMHSSPQPRNPDSLCRWAVYRTSSGNAVIVLNGRVFGYNGKSDIMKVKDRVERIASMMNHEPVVLQEQRKKKS